MSKSRRFSGFRRWAKAFALEGILSLWQIGSRQARSPNDFLFLPPETFEEKRRRLGHCPACGYDRHEVIRGGRCPECGAAAPAPVPSNRVPSDGPYPFWWLRAALKWILTVFAVAAVSIAFAAAIESFTRDHSFSRASKDAAMMLVFGCIPAAPAGVIAALMWRADRQRAARGDVGTCPACGYDRRGIARFAYCPECGAMAPP